jgi:general secretion pathway protein N
MKQRYYVILALCSYLFFALASTPAAKVISLAQKNFNLPVKIYGVQGSIWNGQADNVLVQQHRIDQLKWSINPASLLLASLSADIQASIKEQNVIGHINVNMSGDIHAEDLRAKLSAADIQQLVAMPFGELGGEFILNIQSLDWSGTGIPSTTATIKWRQAKLTLVDTVDLGQVLVNIKPDEKNGLSLEVKNKGGALSIDGSIALSDKKQYKLLLNFNPASNANSNIKQSLSMFAKKQSNGSYRFKQNGNLNQLGL